MKLSGMWMRHPVGLLLCVVIPFLPVRAQSPVTIVSLSSLTFGVQTIGTSSVTQPLMLTNNGPGPSTITDIAFSGNFGGDFTETDNCGALPTTLTAGASCTVNVAFAPTGTGTRAATLVFVEYGSQTFQVVTLTGTGNGSCTTISGCAYQLLNQRASANQNSFYIYKDGDSGFNHGFPSGLFGSTDVDLSKVILDSACIDDPTLDVASGTGCSSDTNRLDGTRGTVFRFTFPPLLSQEDFVGLNFQEPEHYAPSAVSGPVIGNGYNLTPATAVQFDVRSPNGAVVQFGLGGCVTQFFSIRETWTTMSIPIDTLFPPAGDPTAPCPPDLTSTHLLFTVVTNGAQSLNGGTVLLDNVQFTPVPARQLSNQEALSLPLSNQSFGVVPLLNPPPQVQIPPDQANRNFAAIYESSLAVLALLKRGQSTCPASTGNAGACDVQNALEIANALDYALHHDNHGDPLPVAPDGSVGLHSAYASGDIALLNGQAGPATAQAGDVRLAGFSGGATLCPPSGFCLVLDGATGGNNAWAILALAAAYLQSGNQVYLNDAETIGRWIVAMLTDRATSGYGGYFVGFSDGGGQQPIFGKSTENNADIFAAFSLLALIEARLGNTGAAPQWTDEANVAGDFVLRMFNGSSFYAGTVVVGAPPDPTHGNCQSPFIQTGNDVVNTCDFLDAATFTTLAMVGSARYETQIDWTLPLQHVLNTFAETVTAAGEQFSGFDLVSPPLAPAWEFTGQTTETCAFVDAVLNAATFQACAQTYAVQILEAQTMAPFSDGFGVVAATLPNGDTVPPDTQCLQTAFQCIPERVGVAATSWAIYADQLFNPLAFATGVPSPSSLMFPDEIEGTTSPPLTLTLSNQGTAPLAVSSVAITGTNASEFSLTGNSCPTGNALPPGADCAVSVTMTPLAQGLRTATLAFTDSGLGSPQVISLSGMGLPANDFTISIAPALNSIVVGNSASYTITTATSRGNPQTINLSISGLPSGATAAFSANPIVSGGTAILTVGTVSSTPLGSYQLPISGVGSSATETAQAILAVQGPAVLSPSGLTFTNAQAIGTNSAAQSVTLTNNGPASLTMFGIQFGGTFGGDYTQTNNCGSSIASGGSCTINVTFAPTGADSRDATLLVSDNALNSPQTVALLGTGVASCTSISNCAYQELNQRAALNQSNFFVYQDQDSGFNHGFPSGKFGQVGLDLNTIITDAGCIDDPSSAIGCSVDPNRLDATHGTVFRITFPALSSEQFGGLNFEEPENFGANGQPPGTNGYDLTGATSLMFDVRSPGSINVQFGVGQCVTSFMSIGPDWTTVTIPLNSLAPPLQGAPTCPPTQTSLSSTHFLFTVVTNDSNAPNGGTVLVDNIRFVPVPSQPIPAQLRQSFSLPVSTQTFGAVPQQNFPIPTDQVNRNLSTIYEASLTILSLLKRGQPNDLPNARAIADALDYALHHDNQGDPVPLAPDGVSAGLHSAYDAGDLALLNDQSPPKQGKAGNVRLAGFSAGASLCGNTMFCLVLDGATGGNNAWAILALSAAYLEFGNPTYLSDAETIGNWIVGTLQDKSAVSYGGYFVGFSDGGLPKVPLLGKSTEHNADIFAAFRLMAQIEAARGNSAAVIQWTTAAKVAGDFVIQMFDTASGSFFAGTVDINTNSIPSPGICPDTSSQRGIDAINTCDFLDANALPILALAASPAYKNEIDWSLPLQHVLNSPPPNSFTQSVLVSTTGTTATGAPVDVTFQGFDLVPATPAGGVSWEFTGQMAEACNWVFSFFNVTTFSNCAPTYVAQILQAQNSAPFGDGLGLVGSILQNGDTVPPANQCLTTPFECIPERVGLAPTNWAVFADQQLNPLSFAGLDITPLTFNFAGQLVSTTSAAVPVTLTNTSNAPLAIGPLTSSDQGEFPESDNCTATPLVAGSSCTINISFVPSGTGVRTATLTIGDSGLGSPWAVLLSGSGQDFSVTASPASATVTAGQSATFTLTITPLGGFNQAVSLSCSQSPTIGSCSFSQPSVTLGAAPAQVTLTIQTAVQSVDPLHTWPNIPDRVFRYVVFLLAVSCLLLLALFVAIRPQRRLLIRLTVVLLMAIACALCNSCGGGNSNPPPPPPSTGSVTSTITVTGTSGGVSHTTSVTLTVN